MKTEDMCFSKKVYRMLWKFRAGAEGIISWLKRSFSSFQSFVWSGIVAANPVTICKSLL